jgi:hypothetical protein
LVAGCASSPSAEAVEVDVYFVGDTGVGLRLFSEITVIEGGIDDGGEAVLKDLISGEMQPNDGDYVNLWDTTHSLNGLDVVGTTAILDINLGALNVGGEGEQRAIDQLVWTLIGINSSIESVSIVVNGKSVDSLAGHVDATVEFAKAPSYEVLSPVQIAQPREGDTVGVPVVVAGQACTFEANVVWALYLEGNLIDDGFTSAERACPERSSWSVTLGSLDAGNYTFLAQEFSAQDGSVVAQDSRNFTVE